MSAALKIGWLLPLLFITGACQQIETTEKPCVGVPDNWKETAKTGSPHLMMWFNVTLGPREQIYSHGESVSEQELLSRMAETEDFVPNIIFTFSVEPETKCSFVRDIVEKAASTPSCNSNKVCYWGEGWTN